MPDDFQKLYPDEFEEAELLGHGAIVGWMSQYTSLAAA